VFQIADRIMVMRDGAHVATETTARVTRQQLIEWMVGRTLAQEFPPRSATIGEPRLVVRGLSRGTRVRDVSFDVRRGEIVALTGLVGAGRTETARLLFGADRADAGEISLDGRALRIRSPRDAVRAGLCLLTEDRKHQGLILSQSILDNFGLPNLAAFSSLGFVRQQALGGAFTEHIKSLRIKTPHDRQVARNLSGGNQQKVVLAKWLQANSTVLMFDEPTRGIDIGAKHEIYQLLNEQAAQGKAILMISSELPEVLGMADRVLVMREGRINGEITDVRNATQADLLALAVH
jgi:ABC-type sugar transport system ATPase subunit